MHKILQKGDLSLRLTIPWDSTMESNDAVFKSDIVFNICLRTNYGILNIATKENKHFN